MVNKPPCLGMLIPTQSLVYPPFFCPAAFTAHCLSAGSAPCLVVAAAEAAVVEAAVPLPPHPFHLHCQSINLRTIAMEEKKC